MQSAEKCRDEPLSRDAAAAETRPEGGKLTFAMICRNGSYAQKRALQSLGVCRKQTLGPTAAKSHFEPGLTVFCRVTCIFLGLGGLDHILAKRNRSDHQFLTFTTAQRLQLKFLAILVMYNCMRSLLN